VKKRHHDVWFTVRGEHGPEKVGKGGGRSLAHPLLFAPVPMKIWAAFAIGGSLLLTTLTAGAEDGEPSLAPPLPPAPPLSLTPSPCRLGEHSGIEEPDALTATQIVCLELARAGAPPDAHYRVALGRLGSVIVLSVAREGDAPDSTVDSRELRLHGIEETSVAAPRLASALVHGTSLQETETVNNIVSDETRPPASKPTKVHFALGLLAMLPPLDRSATPAPGMNLEVHAEANPFEIVGNFRFGADSSDSQSVGLSFVDFSIGGRYFVSDTDFSPYVGAGFAWSYFSVTDETTGSAPFDGSRSGLGGYLEAGLEILRTRHTHLAFGARLDLPFFSLDNDVTQNYTTSNSGMTLLPGPVGPSSIYYAPLSLELRLTF
jgi:hypothetical protein